MPNRWLEMLTRGLDVSEPKDETILFKADYYARQEYQPRNLLIDHGVVGAVRAISVHNFKGGLKNVPFEDFPLAFLLVLADELQEWSRPVLVAVEDTYFTTSLEKVALLDAIFYARSGELWDIPYANMQAKKLAKFDFRKFCGDKNSISR